ncbi:hypothetical protein P4T29_21875 [Bacillus mobilis]|uniref:hypothetical protein n=1 Tax=Bacillus mobilis TaxID=2026190 RepID=UPI002E21DC38|nr:hypothetical protein [Bacillus mobilis]
MKKWSTYIGYIIFISAIFLCIPMLINSLVFWYKENFTSGTEKEWLSFFSSYAGGFVGAVATLLVVTIQLKHQKKMELEKENRERKFKQLPGLIFLNNEMQKMTKSLTEVYELKLYFDEVEKTKKMLEKEEELEEVDLSQATVNVTNKKYDIKLMSEKSYEYIATIEDVLLHVRLLNCFNFYSDFSQVVNQDIESLTMEYKKIVEEFATNKNEETTFRFTEIGKQRAEIIREKSRVWEEFESQNVVAEFTITLKELQKELVQTKGLKDKQTKGVS